MKPFTHETSAVLAAIIAGLPAGLSLIELLKNGLPDFDLPPQPAYAAYNTLRTGGYVRRYGPYARLTPAGEAALADVIHSVNVA